MRRERHSGGTDKTLTDWARSRAESVLDAVGRPLSQLGIPPNAITFTGFLLQVGVGMLFFRGLNRVGGLVLLLVAPLDALDGAVARAGGRDGPFGAFLDSTLDRFSDAALILGLTAHQLGQGQMLEAALFLVALVAALMVSYTRARAEALGISCQVGLATRLERVFLIVLLTVLGLTQLLAWTLVVLSIVTVLQRMLHVYMTFSRDG